MTARALLPRTAAALLLAASSLAPLAAGQDADETFYRGLAEQSLADHGYADAKEFRIERFLESRTARASLGLFDLHVPTRSLEDGKRAEQFKVVAESLVDLQERWIQYATAGSFGDEASAAALADVETIRGWVERWSKGKLGKVDPSDLVASLDAGEEVGAAVARLQEYMVRGSALGLERKRQKPEPILLMPSRVDFVRFVALAGMLCGPAQKESCWVPEIVSFTETYWRRQALVLPLEYAADGVGFGDYEKSRSMNEKSRTGMRQQVTQLAANALLDNQFDDRLPASIVGGIALNLVIDIYGESNTRVDGDPTARRTGGIETFVWGGQSEGGILPTNSAESRWRERGCKDYFKKVLKMGQRSGAKRSAVKGKLGRLAAFELESADRTERMTLVGPFIGSGANEESTTVPGEYFGDKQEFLRAYRTAFLRFLRTETYKREEDSAEAFSRALHALARIKRGAEAEKALADAFEAPAISSGDFATDDLETRFLNWISR